MNTRLVLKKIIGPIYSNFIGRTVVNNFLRVFWYNRQLRKYFTKNFT